MNRQAPGALDGTHDALTRMKRAYDRGTGCHLTAEMIQSMSVTLFGQIWSEEDPRQEPLEGDAPMTNPLNTNPSLPEDQTFWLSLREPGCIPQRKGPWAIAKTVEILREFIAGRPTAYIDYITVDSSGCPEIQHGPEVLQMADGRSMSTGRKHNQRVREAEASLPEDDAGLVERPKHLLVKRGLYYRPDNQGYTGIKDHAGRYQATDARPEDGITAVHEDEAPEFSKACFDDLARDHLQKKVQSLSTALAEAREKAIEECALIADNFHAGVPVSYGHMRNHVFLARDKRFAALEIAQAIRSLTLPEGGQ